MEENFTLVAQTRANYYTPQPGAVRLRGAAAWENKRRTPDLQNISRVVLTALEVHF